MADYSGQLFTVSSVQNAEQNPQNAAQQFTWSTYQAMDPVPGTTLVAQQFTWAEYISTIPVDIRAKTWSSQFTVSSETLQILATKYTPGPHVMAATSAVDSAKFTWSEHDDALSPAVDSDSYGLPEGSSLSHRFKMRVWIPSLSQFETWVTTGEPNTMNPSGLPYTPDSLSITVVRLPRDGT